MSSESSSALVSRLCSGLMRRRSMRRSNLSTLVGGNLVPATKQAMGFPSGVPGIPDSIFLPENFVNQTLDYDWGPLFNPIDLTGDPRLWLKERCRSHPARVP